MKKKIAKAPNTCGVYYFSNLSRKIIYVGRSINLKERAKSYLYSSDFRINQLLKEAKNISFIKTDNLMEAAILEANLIKKHEPKYNIKEKDDRSFIYLVIEKSKWPYPTLIRSKLLKNHKKADIFGPFQSLHLAKNLLFLLRKVFPFSTCRENMTKPCFHYSIGLCPGKCINAIDYKSYQKNIKYLILFLRGEKKRVGKYLLKNKPEKHEVLKRLDDSILAFQESSFFQRKRIRIEGYDISHLSGKETIGAMIVYNGKEFDKTQYRIFKIKKAKASDDLSSLEEMLERRLNHKEWPYPDLFLVDGGRNQVSVFKKALKKRKIKIPVIGLAKGDKSKVYLDKTPLQEKEYDQKQILGISFKELLSIKDEAHRFANSFRKKVLTKLKFVI